MALTTVVTLKHNDPVTYRKVGAIDNLDYSAYTLVAQMLGVVVKLKVVFRPNARTFQADGRDLRFNHHVTGLDVGIRLLDQYRFTRLRDSQHGVYP